MLRNVSRNTGLFARSALQRARASALARADGGMVVEDDSAVEAPKDAEAAAGGPIAPLFSPDRMFAPAWSSAMGARRANPLEAAANPAPAASAEPPDTAAILVEAFRRGFQSNLDDVSGKIRVSDPDDPYAPYLHAPFDLSPGLPDFRKIVGKTVYGLTEAAPEMVGGIGGAALGTAMSPETPLVSQAIGAGTGAAVVHAAKVLRPFYAAELQQTPEDSEKAFSRALAKAGQDGAFTGASFALFGVRPFAGAVKNLLFQVTAVQPGVAVARRATENLEQDRPIAEGLDQAYGDGAAAAVIPLAAHRSARMLRGRLHGREATDHSLEALSNGKSESAIDGEGEPRSLAVSMPGRSRLLFTPRAYLRSPSGGFEFGEIPEEVATQIGIEAGPILLPRGNGLYGGSHVAGEGRLEELQKLGFRDVPDYVNHVGTGYTQIYRQENGRLRLVRRNGKNHLVAVELGAAEDGPGWHVITAYPRNIERRIPGELLWDANTAQTHQSPRTHEDPSE